MEIDILKLPWLLIWRIYSIIRIMPGIIRI